LQRREIAEITKIIEIAEIIDGKGSFISVYLQVNKEEENIKL
jgi:hypothetical protein